LPHGVGLAELGRPPLLASLGVARPQALLGVEMEGDELREELEHADRLRASNAEHQRWRAAPSATRHRLGSISIRDLRRRGVMPRKSMAPEK